MKLEPTTVSRWQLPVHTSWLLVGSMTGGTTGLRVQSDPRKPPEQPHTPRGNTSSSFIVFVLSFVANYMKVSYTFSITKSVFLYLKITQ